MAASTRGVQAAPSSPVPTQDSSRTTEGRAWWRGVKAFALGPAALSNTGSLGIRGVLGASWRLTLLTTLVGLTVYLGIGLSSKPWFLFDFHGDLFNAARAILHGHNPYRPGYISHLAEVMRRTGGVNPTFAVPVYPAPVLLAAVPFGLVPMWLGGSLFIAASVIGMAWGLRLLGVRDWRCIAVALISWPALFGLWFGTLSPLLVLGAGVAWQARDRTWRCATSISALVLAKVFPWPMIAWPLIQKRWRVFGLTVLVATAAGLAAWSVIGLHSLLTYPRMLSNLSYVEDRAGVSGYAALLSFGIGRNAALVLVLASAGALCIAAWRLARRPGGAANAFGLLVIAGLIASPLVWVHYEVLLFVPIALVSPSLSPIWFLPVVSGLVPVPAFHNHAQMLMWPAIECLLAVALCRAPVVSHAPSEQSDTAILRQIAPDNPAGGWRRLKTQG